MKINMPKSSRGWQFLQHFVGGLYNILLLITGVYIGKNDFMIGTGLAILTFVVNRMSSEITYQTQLRLFAENKEKNEQEKRRPCNTGPCPYRFGSCIEDCTYPHKGCGEDYE